MELLKQKWFWIVIIALVVIAVVTVFVLTGNLDGNDAVGYIGTGLIGVVTGFLARGSNASSVLIFAFSASMLMGATCNNQSWSDNLTKGLGMTSQAGTEGFEFARGVYYKRCRKIAEKCGAVELSTCETYVACSAERHRVFAAFKALKNAVSLVGKSVPLIENSRKAIKK